MKTRTYRRASHPILLYGLIGTYSLLPMKLQADIGAGDLLLALRLVARLVGGFNGLDLHNNTLCNRVSRHSRDRTAAQHKPLAG